MRASVFEEAISGTRQQLGDAEQICARSTKQPPLPGPTSTLERIAHFRARRRPQTRTAYSSTPPDETDHSRLQRRHRQWSPYHLFKVDDDILIDAGTGITTLTLDELLAIDHVVLTHAHLDHVLACRCCSMPWAKAHHARCRACVARGARSPVCAYVRLHLWPDFREIPSADSPGGALRSWQMSEQTDPWHTHFTPLPVTTWCQLRHPGQRNRWQPVFSGDTTSSEAFTERSTPSPTCVTSLSKHHSKMPLPISPRHPSITGRIHWQRNCRNCVCGRKSGSPT